MGRRDDYLYYKTKRRRKRKRDRSLRQRERADYSKGKSLVFLFFFALFLGGGVYFITYQVINKEKIDENEPEYRFVEDFAFVSNTDTIGPVGIYSSAPIEAEIELGEITEEEFMPDFIDTRTQTKAKGIYITFEGITKYYDKIIDLIDNTELNTIIVDVKDDEGRITFEMHSERIDEYGTSRNLIKNIEEVVTKLKEKNIYLIARIVALKDPLLGKLRPDLALHMKDGSIYYDYGNMIWMNPFKREVLDYLIDIAAHCAEIGFDEVNFDYIRFPTDGKISEIDLSDEAGDKTKIDGITEAVKYLCESIKPLGVYVSADVFGGIITSSVDQRNVGQNYVELSKYLDYICPMIYPSHYANGFYGIDYPDTQPYKLMYYALLDSKKALSVIDEGAKNKAKVRTWLQDFTASWLKNYIRYGAKEVRAQIDAVYDAGYEEWFLWNASMNYTKEALMTEEEAEYAYLNRPTMTPVPTPTQVPNATPTKQPSMGQYFDSPWKLNE